MVTTQDDQFSGIRGRLGEKCYASGLLRPLQQIRGWLRQDLRILAYHRVLPAVDPTTFDFDLELVSTTADRFREQMQLLGRRFHPIALSAAVEMLDAGKRLPRDAVVVTFDDGYDDNYKVAFPILHELRVPATFFVATGHIDTGRPYAYDWLVHMIVRAPTQRLSLPEIGLDLPIPAARAARRVLASTVLSRMKAFDDTVQHAVIERLQHEWAMQPDDASALDCRPMNWDQLREMSQAGFDIGSHGANHRMLAKLPPAQMEMELAESKATLARELGRSADFISYPVGGDRAFDARVKAATEATGYRAACSYIYGTNTQASMDRYALYRLPVERTMGIGWFAAMLTLPEFMGYPTVRHIG